MIWRTVTVIALSVLSVGAAQAQAVRRAEQLQLSEHARIDQQSIDAMNVRLQSLEARKASSPGGVRGAWTEYQLAKARAWLAFSFDARAQRDGSGAIEAAFAQAAALVQGLEHQDASLRLDTPLIAGAHRLREYLWQRAEAIKHLATAHCAVGALAQYEVQLVQAGHADQLLGWRHARPYLQAVERLAKDAEARLAACVTEPDPPMIESKTIVAVPTPPPVALIAPRPLVIPDRVHFELNQPRLGAGTRRVLIEFANQLTRDTTARIELRGHTDARGSILYNNTLSLRRAEHVRQFLLHAGIDAHRIQIKAFGKSQLLSTGRGSIDHARNRRVDLILMTGSRVETQASERDLYIESKRRRKVEWRRA